MAFYSLAVIAFLYWQSYRRVGRRALTGTERFQRLWRTLSNASFGIYLVHPLFLTCILSRGAALSAVPVAVLVILTWVLTLAASIALCALLLHIPLLSRLVGREQSAPPVLSARVSTLARQARMQVGNWLPAHAAARRDEAQEKPSART
jgi:peptidoglycan/LPS O-acetylase OafA/YrhL